MNSVTELLEKIKIKYKNIQIYELALTHPSFNADAKTTHHDYERLEYMGDAVLGFVSADLIFKGHPDMDQGKMSKLRSYLVKSKSLATFARRIDLANYIRSGHSLNPEFINSSDKILEDVFEALIGAIYLDQGINIAYRFIKKFLKNEIQRLSNTDLTDAKTYLQELMQSEHRDVHYVVINEEGPAHDKTFTVNVLYDDIVLATGKGKSKKLAEEDAAKKALEKRSIK